MESVAASAAGAVAALSVAGAVVLSVAGAVDSASFLAQAVISARAAIEAASATFNFMYGYPKISSGK